MNNNPSDGRQHNSGNKFGNNGYKRKSGAEYDSSRGQSHGQSRGQSHGQFQIDGANLSGSNVDGLNTNGSGPSNAILESSVAALATQHRMPSQGAYSTTVYDDVPYIRDTIADTMSNYSMSNSMSDSMSNSIADNDFATGRVPPHSLEAEQSIIGAILIDNSAINVALEYLTEKDFYTKQHRLLFEAITHLFEKNEPVDIITLGEVLKLQNSFQDSGGLEYLSYLLDIVPTAANAEYYARVIHAMALRRSVIHATSSIVEDAFNVNEDVGSFIDSVEHKILSLADSRQHRSFHRIADLVRDAIKQVEKRYVNKDQLTGLSSGFVDLDALTSGLQPSDLIIVAGRPAMGKTALALCIARHVGLHASNHGHNTEHNSGGNTGKTRNTGHNTVALFSLEMSREQIIMRMLCSEAKVDSSRVRSGRLAESDFPRIVDAASRLAQASIYVDDTPALSVLEMRAKCRRLHRESPLSLIVIDYLQLMRGNQRRVERREQEISEISRSLKALAKELHVPIIALSQLNRSVETRTDKRPMMADLRESGAIEQDADIIGFVYRDEVYNPDTEDKGIAELIIAKHRNGAIGTVRMAFQGEYTLFDNLADSDDYDYLGNDITLNNGYNNGDMDL